MRKNFKQKLDEAEKRGISIPQDVLSEENIVGVYGFFAIKENLEYCFYIGKSTNIAGRLLASGGHVCQYLKGNCFKLVPQKTKEYLDDNYKIEVRILDKIDYYDTSFSKAAHRLAYAELKRIVEYQNKEQCEFQMPDGVGRYEKKHWEKCYRKSVQ